MLKLWTKPDYRFRRDIGAINLYVVVEPDERKI